MHEGGEVVQLVASPQQEEVAQEVKESTLD